MPRLILFAAASLIVPVLVSAGDAPVKNDYADLSRLLHKMAVKRVPHEFEQKFDWGKTAPIPEKLRFPNLKRNYIKVGERMELANGSWKRIHVKLDDPNKDLRIKVKDVKKLDKGGYRVVIDAEALLRCDGELNQWLNGLLLLRVDGQADAEIAATIVSDVGVGVSFKTFPPEVKVEPTIVELALDLKHFNLNRLGGTLQGEAFRQLGNDLMRDLLRDLLKAAEPIVKKYANEAIADSLKENHGKFSAVELLKAAPKEKKQEPNESMADSTLARLVALFGADTAPDLRRAALKVAGVVGSAKDKGLVTGLVTALADPDPDVRINAAETAGHLKVEAALPYLAGMARRGGAELEPAVRAASQLGARGTKAMAKVMDEALPNLRARIGDVLARSGTGGALLVTAQSLLDDDPKTVDATARSLATQVPTFTPAQRQALLKFLTEALEDKKRHSPCSEAAVVRVLGALHEGKAEEFFWGRIAAPHPLEVRAAALQALGARAQPSSSGRLDKLLACATERDFQLVAPALMILKNLPVNPKNGKHWLRLMDAPDVASRRFALERLRGVESAEAAQAMLAQLHHSDRGLRDEALAALRGFTAGRQALLEQLVAASTPDDAWSVARALAPSARALTAAQQQQLFKQACAYHDGDDRRAAALWFLLREADPAVVRDQLEAKAQALRKKKNYAAAAGYYRLLTHDPACGEDIRFEAAATALKLGAHDLSAEARAADLSLQQFARLLQNAGFDVAAHLAAAKWFDPEDLFYLGFHFAEQTHRARDFGRQVLELVVERSPKSETGKQAKRKLKSAALA